jgi:hypothetical protein
MSLLSVTEAPLLLVDDAKLGGCVEDVGRRYRASMKSRAKPRLVGCEPELVSQDGDVYGRTVNLAARIASYAQAGQVVVSQETAQRCGDRQVWFDPLGSG